MEEKNKLNCKKNRYEVRLLFEKVNILTGRTKISNLSMFPKIQEDANIQGLFMLQNLITEEYENEIVTDLNSRTWDDGISRLTQHYGYRYPYDRSKRLIEYDSSEGKKLNPDGTSFYKGLYSIKDSTKIKELQEYLKDNLGIDTDQCIVNRYDKHVTIGRHTDDEKLFGDTIAAFSLLSPTLMRFQNKHDKKIKYDVILSPRSLVIMRDQARYDYTHEIPGRKTFQYQGKTYKKPEDYLRISVTYRKVKSLTY